MQETVTLTALLEAPNSEIIPESGVEYVMSFATNSDPGTMKARIPNRVARELYSALAMCFGVKGK